MSTGTLRALRAVLLVLALAAAVAVFVLGRRDGDPAWEIPALVLIGVVVLIIGVATSPGQRRGRATALPTVRTNGYEELHHHANPHHVADPSAAEQHGHAPGAVPAASTLHVGMTDVVVPAASFPDAGHGHGPVIRVADDMPPPPLYAVLQSDGLPVPPGPTAAPAPPPVGASAPPPPPDPATLLAAPGAAAGVDPVLLDLRPETGDPMVMRMIVGEPPPPGSRADVTSPDVSAPDLPAPEGTGWPPESPQTPPPLPPVG